MSHYRYIFLSLRDDQVIEEINLFGTYGQRQIGSPGQFNGSFTFDQTGKKNIDLVAATTPGKTWLVVERNDVPVWWGIVWSRTYQSQAKECQLFAWGFEAYPQRQRVLADFIRTAQPSAQIFCDLWTDMQSIAGRNLNINIPTANFGTTNSLTVLASDRAYYNDAMDSLANGTTGFDWTIDLNKNADGTYNKSLRVGFPTMGVSQGDPNVWVFEYPGNILNYYETESMTDAGTNVFVLGAGEGSDMVVSETSQQAMIDQGWPRWDVDASYKDVSSQTLLDQLAQQQKVIRKPPMPSFKATLKGDLDPVFGSYNLGDACQLVITDGRNPSSDGGNTPGISVPTTIIGFEIRPQDSQGTEEVNLILPGDVLNG